ncbi:myosin heavy chain, cardiac muscle isoform-like [Mobula hypostoma]|uniref:myosin heavy chain, cardiac muscle isoform-like n=1 Tax=Mobula hypostoma TaxID=723540 RepID=UPI002FC3922C
MSEADKEKTAVIGPLGFFQSKKMSQGISGALATFSWGMGKTMGDVDLCGVLMYLDDLLTLGFALEDYEARNYPTYQLNFLALEQTTVAEELNDCLYGIKFEVETEKQNSEQKLEKLIQNKLDDLHVGEDKGSCLSRANRELRAPRGESEYNSEEVKQWRTDLGRGERKLEGDLKMIIDSVNEMGKLEVEQEAIIKKKELEISSETNKLKESKKKLTPRLQEAEEAAKAAQAKCSSLKKAK